MPEMPPPLKRKKVRRRVKEFISDVKWWLGAFSKRLAVLGAGCTVIFGIWFFLSQPDIGQLNEAHKKPGILIVSADGQIVGSYGDIYGDMLTYDEFPQSLIDAVLATEDRNFFHHFGVDPMGIGRAMVADVRAGHAVQGGSTITQQVAKNVFLTPERSVMRKLREIFLALALERRYTKQQILAIYLNRVYLGAGNYGVDAAAKRYFNKSARELTLSESAILAGLLKAPSRFSPTSSPDMAKKRAEQILMNMADAGYLTQKQAESAKLALAQTIKTAASNNASSSMYFTDWVMDQLPDFIGDVQEDLVVTTTFRLPLQRMAEQAIAGVMDKEGETRRASQAALLSMTPDGAVVAMIGGRSYAKSPYNRAVQAHRQPGSSFKIFVYLTALENGFTPSTPVVDQPVTIPILHGSWSPKNYTGDYKGEMPLSEAVAQSINTVSVQVSQAVGLDNIVAMARRLGVSSELQPDPSLALGTNEVTLLELVTAYAHLADNGAIVAPYGILRISTASGQPLYERQPISPGLALNPSVVGMMNSMLEGVIDHGTGRAANIGRPAAGKTGTTSDYRDAWFLGYTPDLVTGVWVGNDDNTEMKKVTGGTLPAPIWRDFMKAALEKTPPHSLPISYGYSNGSLPWQQWRQTPPWTGALPPPARPGRLAQAPSPENPLLPPQVGEPAPEQPPAPVQQMPVQGGQPIQPAQQDEGLTLGPAFWNKLFDGNGDQRHP